MLGFRTEIVNHDLIIKVNPSLGVMDLNIKIMTKIPDDENLLSCNITITEVSSSQEEGIPISDEIDPPGRKYNSFRKLGFNVYDDTLYCIDYQEDGELESILVFWSKLKKEWEELFTVVTCFQHSYYKNPQILNIITGEVINKIIFLFDRYSETGIRSLRQILQVQA